MDGSQDLIKDVQTEWKLSKLFPDLVNRWRNVQAEMWRLHQMGLKVSEGYRTFTDQWRVWSQGRGKNENGDCIVVDLKHVVTYAQPGMSWHNYGLALDSCFLGNDPFLKNLPFDEMTFLWEEYGRLCQAEGLCWGGSWQPPKTDRPHCEITYGLNIHVVQIIYEDQGIKGVWNKCKQTLNCGLELE